MSNYALINGELYKTDELMHYGVLGMKWGKRKNYVTVRQAAKNVKKARKDVVKSMNDSPNKHTLHQYKAAVRKSSKESVANDKKFNKTAKDFNKLKSRLNKAQKAAKDYYDYVNKNSYMFPSGNTVRISNTKMLSKAKKYEKKADKMISKLEKKYKTVSAVANYDSKKGKSYVDVKLDNLKERIYEDD